MLDARKAWPHAASKFTVYQRLALAVVAVLLAALFGAACKKPKTPGCKGDGDCKDGKVCLDNVCQVCKSNDDCPDGKVCDAGACKPAECKVDTDCDDGKSCIDGLCRTCNSNADCGPGGRCASGLCIRAKACKVDDDCSDDEDCVDGRCQKPWKAPAAASSCQLGSVYFGLDDDALSSEARDTLGENAQCLEKSGSTAAVLYGHTDDTGTDEYNIALSERRAAAVADYLARLGIDPARLHIVPKGETEPSGKGPDQDRRVEFSWK